MMIIPHPGKLHPLAAFDLPQGVTSFFERVAERPWVAIVELLLIGSVVYAILRFLHGTRGARLVRAVITILGVSFALVWLVAGRFGLERINVLYSYFILGVFLVSLVAFQSELRRMLIRLGQGGWLQRWLKSTDDVIDPIVVAAQRLSKKKIGALIAIERSIELGAVAETGIRLEAAVSAELLETIFWPGTPLHDLGVIVHGGRILAAGCQFPLAESGEVDRALGSRHRAALGMSQEIDGLVVVVSEETGAISVAVRGRFRRSLTPDALREALTRELIGSQDSVEPRRDAAQRPRDTSQRTPEAPEPASASELEASSPSVKVTSDGTG